MAIDNLKKRQWLTPAFLAVAFSYQLGGASLSLAAFADASQVIGFNNEGVKALNTGNFQLAITKFEAALKVDPSYQLARDNLAIAHNNYGLQLRNNPKEALKQFHMALYLNRSNATTMQNVEGIIKMMGKNPRSFKDRMQLGDEARLSGDFVGALIEYSEACKIQDDPALHVKMGDIYRVRDENDKAINEYQLASKLKDSADIEVKLGQAYQAKKDVPNAIAAYGAALKFNNTDPDVLDALVAGWEEALKENPLAPENHIGLGQAFAYRGDFGQSAEEYKQAIRLSPGRRNPTAERLLAGLGAMQKDSVVNKHVNVGLDLQAKKQYAQAINEYKIALQADPQNDTVWVDLGTAYQAMEDFPNAIACYNQALKINASNAAARQGIQTATAGQQDKQINQGTEAGAALFKQGQYDAAILKYQEVLKLTPNDASTWFDLGATYQAKKDYDNAISCYDKAISFDPKNAAYPKAKEGALDAKAKPIIDAAVAKHGAKDYAGAIPLYQQALVIRPNSPGLWFNLASAQYAMQNYLDARESYQHALQVDRKGQINCLYLIGTIDENYGKGQQALGEYQKYIQESPTGTYAVQAKERITALSKNPSDIVKIKSETELASIKRAEEAYASAVKYQTSKNFAAAEPLYIEAIGLQPQNPDYVYGLGTLYQIMEQYDKAGAQYQKALQIDPSNKDYANALQSVTALSVDPVIDQAVQKQTSGDLPGAIELYKQAIAKAPMVARAHTDLGTAYQQSDNFIDARKEYAEGYRLDPKGEIGDLYLMGPLDENSNQGAQALGEYQRYVKEAPGGQYAQAAKARIADLQKNPGNVQKLSTRAETQGMKEAEDAYGQAVQLQQSGKYDDAIPLYIKATGMQPKNDSYAYAFGTCYQAKGDMVNAITWYQKAIQLNPSNKDYPKVLAAAKGASAAPKMDDAVKKQQAGDNVAAIALYKEALAADPDNARGYTNLGSAYQANDQFAEARAAYQKALDLDKKGEVFNYYYIGLLDENAGQGAKAIQDYQSYIQADPRGQFAGQAQGRISTLKANPNNTQKITTAAETKKSGEAQDAYNEAIKLQGENKYDEAIAAYKKALAVSPNEAAYWYAMGTACQAKNDLDAALEDYKKAISINPKEPAYKSAMRTIAQAKAAPLVNSAIEKQTKKNDIPGAIADYEAALRLDPDDAGTHMNLGTAYQAGNKNDKAAAEYRRAIQLDPKNADAHYFLATVLEALNQKALAIREYEDYLRLAPSGSYANDIRARLKILRGR